MKRYLILFLLISFCGGSSDSAGDDSYPQLKIVEVSNSIPNYDRDDWNHWIDENSDCQNTRHEVLIEESLETVTYTSDTYCTVSTGKWFGYYTGEYYYNASDLDMDHFIPLKNAHQSGGYSWSSSKKEEFANYRLDPDNLIAVNLSANRSKGVKGPDEWKPTNTDYWCQYAYDWIRIKEFWSLTATQDEWDALVSMIETCPEDFKYADAQQEPLAELPTPTTTTTVTIPKKSSTTLKMTLEEYNEGWIEKFEIYPVLTKDEFDKSIEFLESYQVLKENFPFTELGIIVDSNNYVCERKTTGTIISSYANERHPLSLYISETGDNENVGELTIYEYIVTEDYNCSLENSEEGLFLWGPLFFQDNQWWGFIEYEDDYWEQSAEPDVLIRSFAKRVSLGSSINNN
ncbi:HNH endonuclease family protein [Acidimicrobiia bacterium]|nr:HNH endonuclease family protein [Acidimicrobiia bacterium]